MPAPSALPFRTPLPLLALTLALASCAATRAETASHPAPRGEPVAATVNAARPAEAAPLPTAAPVRLTRPDAAYARIARFGRREVPAQNDLITFDAPADGIEWRELIQRVATEARVTIVYDEANATIRGRRVTLRGKLAVPRGDLVAWSADVAAVNGLALIPLGPADRRQFVLLDMANPVLSQTPEFVPEDELPEYAGRGGLYISSVLKLPAGVDTARVRQMLSQFSTRTAGLGRVTDLSDTGSIVVSDFAHVVATMRRALDEMEIRAWEEQERARD